MDWAFLGKIALAAPGLAALIWLVVAMLRNRLASQREGNRDRADEREDRDDERRDRGEERDALLSLVGDQLEHSIKAMESVARAQTELAAASREQVTVTHELALAIRDMSNRCPCGNGGR